MTVNHYVPGSSPGGGVIENTKIVIHQFSDFLTKEECNSWIKKAPVFVGRRDWPSRTVSIIDDKIVTRVQSFLEKELNIKTTCFDAQIQLWPINSKSELHVHYELLPNNVDYNSMIYLNDDFDGGNFFTENEVLKPVPGLLTFFNGMETFHGVSEVLNAHRYTLIFWWQNTVLCDTVDNP